MLVTNGDASRYSAGTQNDLSSAGQRALERRRRAQCPPGRALWWECRAALPEAVTGGLRTGAPGPRAHKPTHPLWALKLAG